MNLKHKEERISPRQNIFYLTAFCSPSSLLPFLPAIMKYPIVMLPTDPKNFIGVLSSTDLTEIKYF